MTCTAWGDIIMDKIGPPSALNLHVGDVVEVRSSDEILASLDENETLDSLPFMPEMLKYCGQRFRVFKRAHKSCDVIRFDGTRRMENAVFLEGLRCDGEAHGGCQAYCQFFWKEAWLKKVPRSEARNFRREKLGPNIDVPLTLATNDPFQRAWAKLIKVTQVQAAAASSDDDIRYSCQATELRKATKPLPYWDVRQYWLDWWTGNIRLWVMFRALAIFLFNKVQHYRRGGKHPFIEGTLARTPQVLLNVQPGELVRLKPKNEILKTLDRHNRNRGLSFDKELVKFCGGTYRVARRVEREIDNATGKMMHFNSDCIVLDGVVCEGDYNRFCQRNIFHYIRETWLERVEAPRQAQHDLPACPHAQCEETVHAGPNGASRGLAHN